MQIAKDYSNYENVTKEINNDEEWRKKHKILAYFVDIFDFFCYLPDKLLDTNLYIKTFIQRGKYGIAESDIWSLDYYISKVMIRGLIYLKDGNTIPITDVKKTIKQRKKEWNKILDSMIYTFRTAREISNDNIIYLSSDKSDKEYKQWKKSIKEINSKGTPIRLLSRKEAKKYEDGFILLQKWFLDLWD